MSCAACRCTIISQTLNNKHCNLLQAAHYNLRSHAPNGAVVTLNFKLLRAALSKKHHKEPNLNLLPHDSFSVSTIGRVLTWSLSTGRYIVVFTEMIVILTFLSRFTLDRQLTDLNEAILRKQALIESYDDLEPKVRQIQKKTEFIRQLKSRIQVLELFDFLDQNAPESITFDNLSIRPEGFSLEAVALSATDMSSFITALKTDPRFLGVSLDKVSVGENDTGIGFGIRAGFKTATPSPAPVKKTSTEESL